MKEFFQKVNSYLRKEEPQPIVFSTFDAHLPSEFSLLRRFMRLTNKTLLGLNNIHFFRKEWIACACGMALGFFVWKLDEESDYFRRNYKTASKNALVDHILKNNQIKSKLKEVLDHNIFRNQDIQYSLHQLLLYKAIEPQLEELNKLVRLGIVTGLEAENTKLILKKIASQQMQGHQPQIEKAALDFLRSETLDRIVAGGLSSVIRGQMFQNLIANYMIELTINELKKEANLEMLYGLIRQNFIM